MMKPIQWGRFSEQGEDVQAFIRQLKSERISHAVLISGPEGVGKKTMATLASKTLLCSASDSRPCGICKACLQAAALEHPDQIVIRKGIPLSPDIKEGRASIPVEDIRELIRICSASSFEGGNRVALVFDAEALTPQAQNAFLKTLEEPPENTFFLLVTVHPESLLPTIISRCRTLRLKPWSDDYILDILREEGIPEKQAKETVLLAEGSIGKALQLVRDEDFWKCRDDIIRAFFREKDRSSILLFSNEWKNRKGEAQVLFSILESCMHQMMTARFLGQESDFVRSLPPQWKRFAGEAEPDQFNALSDLITESRKEAQSSVNFQAVTEQLLLGFMGEGSKWLQ